MALHKKRKQQKPDRFFYIILLIIVLLIILVGSIFINMLRKKDIEEGTQANETTTLSETELRGRSNTDRTKPETQVTAKSSVPQIPDSPCVVQEQEISLDETYFSDAVFVGDSRMEGFRNQSGITTGTFLTGVGMTPTNIFDTPFISTQSGNITAYQALYNSDYKKVYVLLGTNNLGDFDYDVFKENYRICIGEIRKILPDAVFYVIEIPYVEEEKVTTGDYITNSNIVALNEKILELCEENNYNYIAVNEILADGSHSLIEGATSDGVHIYDSYCRLWLDYLKSHYIAKNDTTPSDSNSIGTD